MKIFQFFLQVFGRATYKFYLDDCFSRAASLSYTTLFAMVPAAFMMISVLSLFGVNSEEVVEGLIDQVLPTSMSEIERERIPIWQVEHFNDKFVQYLEEDNNSDKLVTLSLQTALPVYLGPVEMSFRSQILDYLDKFLRNVRALSSLSLVVLIFTAITLFNTIESALNSTWRVNSDQGFGSKIFNFSALLTLGPMLVAISIATSAKFGSLLNSGGVETSGFYSIIHLVLPVIIIWFGLTLLFHKVPATKVSFLHAAFGGLVAAIIFETLKSAFAFYLGGATTYSVVYGALAALPLFLFWMYLAWCVVLFGAEIAYQAGSLHVASSLKNYKTELGEVGSLLGLRILQLIGNRFISGEKPPSESELAIHTGADPVLIRSCLEVLNQGEVISSADPKTRARSLLISPSQLTISKITSLFYCEEFFSSIVERNLSQLNPENEKVGQKEFSSLLVDFYLAFSHYQKRVESEELVDSGFSECSLEFFLDESKL